MRCHLSEATLAATSFSTVTYEAMRQASSKPMRVQLYTQSDGSFRVDVPVNGPVIAKSTPT